jgi:hypothetical protein
VKEEGKEVVPVECQDDNFASLFEPGDEEFMPEISQNFEDGFLKTEHFKSMVKCIVDLQKERLRVINERDELLQEREVALKDPATYMEGVINKKSSLLPSLLSVFSPSEKSKRPTHHIPEIPEIDFEKYDILASKECWQ